MAASAAHGARRQLISATQAGGVTLVIGAGVSVPSHIPDWNTLAKAVWRHTFKDAADPWSRKGGNSPKDLPQFLPIIFELVYQRLGEAAFFDLLKSKLYDGARFPLKEPKFGRSNESLAVIARLLVAEQKRSAGRRISSVITLNADDLIEQAVSRAAGNRTTVTPGQIIGPITRSTHRILNPSMIPIYHVHGFLPSENWLANSGQRSMLVFTDLQYWGTSATASSFANRIVSAALSEGRCIFIGVSMQDINLLRWLALRGIDRDRDQIEFGKDRLLRWMASGNTEEPFDAAELLKTAQAFLNDPIASKSGTLEKNFKRHFWIRPPSTDPSGFLSGFLEQCRGVRPVDIDDWRGPSFRRLMTKCFPRTNDPG